MSTVNNIFSMTQEQADKYEEYHGQFSKNASILYLVVTIVLLIVFIPLAYSVNKESTKATRWYSIFYILAVASSLISLHYLNKHVRTLPKVE